MKISRNGKIMTTEEVVNELRKLQSIIKRLKTKINSLTEESKTLRGRDNTILDFTVQVRSGLKKGLISFF